MSRWEELRAQFPALHQEVHGKPLVYLDSAATALKPQRVIDAVTGIYARDCANIHRGVHTLSQRATDAYEQARANACRFLNSTSERELIFVRGTTEGINLVAQTWAREHVGFGDEILVSELEHHSNIVPWQMLCERVGAKLVVVPIDDRGGFTAEDVLDRIGDRTKLIAMAHVSNALGTILPVADVVAGAREKGVKVLVDGAQGAPHIPVDVQALGCDFYAFSGHKAYGPTGVGVLYVRDEILRSMRPWQGGGEMIRSVSFSGTTYAPPPARFEAGTPDIAGAVGLGESLAFLMEIGMDDVAQHESEVLAFATEALEQVPGLTVIGTAEQKTGVVSFSLDGIHPHDIGTVLDRQGVAIRTGHHCAQPVMERMGLPGTSRASFGLYTNRSDIEALVSGLRVVREIMG